MSIVNTTAQTLYAAATTTGAEGGAGSDTSAVGAAGASTGAAPPVAGFSNGGRGVGSSITGGFSSTFAGALTACFLDLKKSVTRDDNRRLALTAFVAISFSSA